MNAADFSPNILLITSDQHHWNALGALNPELKTPVLDRLAGEGLALTRAYCPNPTCTPTRASIITGKYPSKHGAWSLGTKLPETEPVIGDSLRRAGYRTALVGKAHFQPLTSTAQYQSLESHPIMQDLPFWRRFHGPFYGFERVELARNHADESHVGQHYAIWMEDKGFRDWRKCFSKATGTSDPQTHKWNIPERFHYDTWIAEKTCELLETYREKGDRFFLWSSFFDPHPPYLVPEPWDTMYDPAKVTVPRITPGEHDHNPPHFGMTQQEKPDFSPYRESGHWLHGMHSHLGGQKSLPKDIAVYYGMISLMDRYIGVILDRLAELGLAENTIVIFTTDHGHFFGQHGLVAKGPFHYEDMVKLPFIVRWPGKIRAGTTSAALSSVMDLGPTILSMAGAEPLPDMDGADLSPVWLGQREKARDFIIVENRHDPTTVCLKTYVDKRWKVTAYYRRPYGEIFDLENDPGEVNNLWDDPALAPMKAGILSRPFFVRMGRETLWMPRIAGA